MAEGKVVSISGSTGLRTNGRVNAAPDPSERKVAVLIQVTVSAVVGVLQGRRTIIRGPLEKFNNAIVDHTPGEYAKLYPQIEAELDDIQRRLDAGEDLDADASGS